MQNFVTVRLPPSGLGHSLESYSRAFTYYANGYAEFVHPNWFKLHVGPYLRRELDKRDYWRIIKTPSTWGLHPLHSFRRFFCRVVSEAEFDPRKNRQFLIVQDEGPHSFARLQPHKQKFVSALESLSRHTPKQRFSAPSIGIFHRSGDFRVLGPGKGANERVRRTHGYGYIPPEYAAEALRKCRRIAGWQVPAVLSTDASLDEVRCITDMGAVTLARVDSSFANMLEMRHHDVLILGTSSYGRWSFFMGEAFGVFPKTAEITNDSFQPLGIAGRQGAWFVFETETSLNALPTADAVRERLVAPCVTSARSSKS